MLKSQCPSVYNMHETTIGDFEHFSPQHICKLSPRKAPQLSCIIVCVRACGSVIESVCQRESKRASERALCEKMATAHLKIVCLCVCVCVCVCVSSKISYICAYTYVVCVCIPRIISWNSSLSNSAVFVRCLPASLKRQCSSISDI
jgi:hypothetical protein